MTKKEQSTKKTPYNHWGKEYVVPPFVRITPPPPPPPPRHPPNNIISKNNSIRTHRRSKSLPTSFERKVRRIKHHPKNNNIKNNNIIKSSSSRRWKSSQEIKKTTAIPTEHEWFSHCKICPIISFESILDNLRDERRYPLGKSAIDFRCIIGSTPVTPTTTAGAAATTKEKSCHFCTELRTDDDNVNDSILFLQNSFDEEQRGDYSFCSRGEEQEDMELRDDDDHHDGNFDESSFFVMVRNNNNDDDHNGAFVMNKIPECDDYDDDNNNSIIFDGVSDDGDEVRDDVDETLLGLDFLAEGREGTEVATGRE